jgi:Fe-S-cluster containining protein
MAIGFHFRWLPPVNAGRRSACDALSQRRPGGMPPPRAKLVVEPGDTQRALPHPEFHPPSPALSRTMQKWRCISGCGACCRLDPALRGEALEALDVEQRQLYLSMVGVDGWCIHFDTGGRRCRIYAQRPEFCRVENLVRLFGGGGDSGRGEVDRPPLEQDADALAISCCRQQIRSECGGRGRVMRRFESAIRR